MILAARGRSRRCRPYATWIRRGLLLDIDWHFNIRMWMTNQMFRSSKTIGTRRFTVWFHTVLPRRNTDEWQSHFSELKIPAVIDWINSIKRAFIINYNSIVKKWLVYGILLSIATNSLKHNWFIKQLCNLNHFKLRTVWPSGRSLK